MHTNMYVCLLVFMYMYLHTCVCERESTAKLEQGFHQIQHDILKS